MRKVHYVIIFKRLYEDDWHMKCSRTYSSCLKMALKHLFKGHCIYFKIKPVK